MENPRNVAALAVGALVASGRLDRVVDRVMATPKVGRNEPCPCGSGKKFKRCCINAKAAA